MIDYLLKYVSELQGQALVMSGRDDIEALRVTWARIDKVNDLIEAELTRI